MSFFTAPGLVFGVIGAISAGLVVVLALREWQYRQAVQRGRDRLHELQAQRQALEQAAQLRESFMAKLSHELRTPMNVALGFNALLLERVQDRPEARQVLEHTRGAAEHLMAVINDMQDHAQLQLGQLVVQPQTFALRPVVQHAFEWLRPRVQRSALDYRLEFDEQLPQWVHSDRHRLTQVLTNLLGNALKFTHQGQVVLRVRWQNPGVLFEVQDTGIGIAQAQQPRIFSRFGQADQGIQARYGGNGLGLAISRQLVELLGGESGFESEWGQGSRFWFRLPLSACEAPPGGAEAGLEPLQTRAMPWRFLVVDDHPVSRLLTCRVLQQAWPQAQVLEAADGQQCLQQLAQGPVDLVLMDMLMPVMDGIEATQRLRQHPAWQTLPVLGLTANANPVDLKAFEAAGLSAIVLKPCEPARLCSRAEQLLLGRA